ncbi:DUF859 family phage minor structural protein [uncultured Clostridium sp.]|jgi:hypothetical protein|uniref:DUF859 family phage minor structural protein n=1 Tax=uncultured Clostridium sp. TaxID=59620 RepID=UPI0026336F73|nr:DUF859 family phage minor structural protein [uncultured Clostridium sp.]
MAIASYTSGNFNTTNQYIKFNVVVDLISQDISSNTSVVNVRVNIWRTNTGYTTYGSGTLYTNIDGVQRNVSITPNHKITNSAICLFNQNISVGHNNDGSKTLVLGLSISHNQFNSSPTNVEFRCNLKTIPRASSFTLSSTDVVAGASITGNISRASGSFKHDVYLGFGTKTWTLATNVDTSFSATIPMDTLKEIPNAVKGQGNIRVVTKNGNSEVGQKAINFFISAASNIVPSFSSLAISRVDNGVPSAWGVYVKGKSKATLTINGASGIHGSTINKYEISGGGYSTTDKTFTTGVLNTVGTVTFTGVITDSRGRTATKTVNCSVVDYTVPTITDFVVNRCNSSGSLTDEGTYIKVKPVFAYSTVNGKNTISARVEYKTKSSTSWTNAGSVTSGKEIVLGSGKIDANTSYDVRLIVQDAFESVVKISTIPTASTTLDFRNGGKGIAIGKVSEKDGFEVNWDSNFLKALKVNGNDVYHNGRKPSKTDVGLGNVNNWGASSDKAANSTSQYATTNMVAQVRAEKLNASSGVHNGFFTIDQNNKQLLIGCGAGDVFFKNNKSGGYLQFYDDKTLRIDGVIVGEAKYPVMDRNTSKWHTRLAPVMSDGVMEVGRYIDFHKDNVSSVDYNVRLDATGTNLWCSTTIAQASDRKMKENIEYLDDKEIPAYSERLSKTKFKDFIKDFKFAMFNYKGSSGRSFGFIAQDFIKTEVGQFFIKEIPIQTINKETGEIKEEDSMCFGLADYTTVVAKALQEEIREKDEKIKNLELRLEKIEKILEQKEKFKC